MPAMHYVTRWRMHVALSWLQEREIAVAGQRAVQPVVEAEVAEPARRIAEAGQVQSWMSSRISTQVQPSSSSRQSWRKYIWILPPSITAR